MGIKDLWFNDCILYLWKWIVYSIFNILILDIFIINIDYYSLVNCLVIYVDYDDSWNLLIGYVLYR